MTKKDEKVQPAEEAVKINKWDGSAVKHALDDAVKNCLFAGRPQLKEQFGLINTRLVLCALAVGVAVLAHGWDYTHPFPESRPVLLFSVIAYFALMGILTVHTTFREKGTFAVAVQTDGSSKGKQIVWEASSDMKKYDDKYILTLAKIEGNNRIEFTTTKSCAKFICENGVVLDNLLANEVNNAFNALSAGKKDK